MLARGLSVRDIEEERVVARAASQSAPTSPPTSRRRSSAWTARMPVMSPAKKKKTGAAKLRTWRVSILKNRVHFLGFVQAPDRQAAEAAAAKQFNISEEQRTRLIVQERD
jgi:hypothetical protein